MKVSSMTAEQFVELNRRLRLGEISYRDFLAAYTSYPLIELLPKGSPSDSSITCQRIHSFGGRA